MRKKRILIVEDEVSLRKALADKFKSAEMEILEAKNGEEGLRIALAEKPDLILLDIIMPRMDGITMLGELRKDKEWGVTAPVIVLTNLSEAGKVAEVTDRKVYDYLVKSDWKLEDLVEKVKEKLDNK